MSDQKASNKKRKASDLEIQFEKYVSDPNLPPLQDFVQTLAPKTRHFKLNQENQLDPNAKKIKISLKKDCVKVSKGFWNLPKELIIESLFYQGIRLKLKNSVRRDHYYECINENCPYVLKIHENPENLKSLTTSTIISNWKNFSIEDCSQNQEGICELTEIDSHIQDTKDHKASCASNGKENKKGNKQFDTNSIFLGLSYFVKFLIENEKFYQLRPKTGLVKLQDVIENNRLPFPIPHIMQLQNYIYKFRAALLVKNYPEMQQFMTELCEKSYSNQLRDDEMFIIFSEFKMSKVSILFSTRALVTNLMRQNQFQDSFIHIDATYKLIDLGLPVITISTETKSHNFRPICFFIAFSESKDQVSLMLREFSSFLKKEFNFDFLPKYIMSDNSDAIISGCKDVFKQEYTHLSCIFHLMKNLKGKCRSKDLKPFQAVIFYGIKCLKNCHTREMFDNTWKLVKDYWIDSKLKVSFIDTFESEYIKKKVSWFNGSAFYGKSRSNNSLESGNKVLKDFFDRKPNTLKGFLVKMKDFLREYSTLDKTEFKDSVQYSAKHLEQSKKILEDAQGVMFEDKNKNLYYFARKGMMKLEKGILLVALEKHMNCIEVPKSIAQHHESKMYFRTVNFDTKTCDCTNFYKYSYCKHILMLKIMKGELADPFIMEKGKPGRKSKFSKALKK